VKSKKSRIGTRKGPKAVTVKTSRDEGEREYSLLLRGLSSGAWARVEEKKKWATWLTQMCGQVRQEVLKKILRGSRDRKKGESKRVAAVETAGKMGTRQENFLKKDYLKETQVNN